MLLFAFNYSGTEQSAAVELTGTGPEKYGVTNLYSNHTCVIGRDVSGLSIPVKLDGFDTCVYKLEPVDN